MTLQSLYAVRKSAEGTAELFDAGPVTVSLEAMDPAELNREWGWMIEGHLPGDVNKWHRLPARGFHVHHASAGLIGALVQTAVTRIHVEWYDPGVGDYLCAGRAQRLRHGAAYIVNARRRHGYPVPADPKPIPTPPVVPPVLARVGDVARYCGSLDQLRGQLVRVEHCYCEEDFCPGYRAEPLESDLPGVVHARRTSFIVEPA